MLRLAQIVSYDGVQLDGYLPMYGPWLNAWIRRKMKIPFIFCYFQK